MKHKAEQRLDEILLQVGPTSGPFIYPGLMSNRSITRAQRRVLLEKYIDKLHYFDKWYHVKREDTFYRETNRYMWKDPQEMEQRYEELVNAISPHNPRKGRKPKCHKQIATAVEGDHWETALDTALQNKQYDDVAIIASLDRRVQDDKVIITSAYNEKGGRLYSPIQNISSLARRDLFRGWYDYDINAALPSVIYQLNPVEADLILEYIQHKEEKRGYLADLLGIELERAKRIINAVFFGAKTSEGTLHWDLGNEQCTSLVRMLRLGVLILMRDKWFSEFSEQVRNSVKTISDRIKNQAVKIDKQWNIRNLNGDTLVLPRWHQGRAVCHFYYGIERMAISALNLPSSNVVLIHDGFVVDREVQLPVNFNIGGNLSLDLSFSKERL